MKRMVLVLILFMVVGMAYVTALYAESVYYVQSVKAKVMSDASFKAAVIAEVGKGSKLSSLGRDGSWIKVKYNNTTGYVSSLLLSTHPPIAKTGIIKGDEAEIKQGVRRRASSYTSAAAARGLTQDDRRRLSKEEKVDYESLEKIESFKLSADEINRFMEGNK
jgi:hypothetical protein